MDISVLIINYKASQNALDGRDDFAYDLYKTLCCL